MGITLIEGDHWEKKGYWYKLYFNHPIISFYKIINMHNREHIVRKFEANTSFYLTRDFNYVNIGFNILGLGLGIEIQSTEV